MFDIIMWEDENGYSPVDEFLDELKRNNNNTRLFYFFEKNRVVIIDHAIVKKTQKTPNIDLQLAIERKLSYERRQKDDI